jgi:2'-5' RNA ligase
MTVGFSDLSKTEFWQAWDNFKNRPISFSFMADHLALLRHNGKTWDVYRKFDFAPEGPAN